MPRVSTYLNFMGTTEDAFAFYGSVFGTEPSARSCGWGTCLPTRMCAPLTDTEKRLIMHMELPILAGHVLMATDMMESQGNHCGSGTM